VADVEPLPFASGALDLVVSAFALQTVNDLPGVLIQIRRALKPDGLFLAALLGGDTLAEFARELCRRRKRAHRRGNRRGWRRFPTCATWRAVAAGGLRFAVADVDRLVVRYPSPLALMADLRRMGATNPLVERRRVPLRRAILARMMEVYADRFPTPTAGYARASTSSGCRAGRPTKSQQQPLQPGLGKGPARRRAGNPGDQRGGEAGARVGGITARVHCAIRDAPTPDLYYRVPVCDR